MSDSPQLKQEPEALLASRRWLRLLLLLLIVLKLWLVGGQDLRAVGGSKLDDQLFLELAQHLISGEWLGPYDERTLIKGPFYSFWIAGAFLAGVPLLLSQHVLYIAACAFLSRSVRPLLRSEWLSLGLFSLLLFNPMSYSDRLMARVVRAGITPALAVLVIGCGIALATSADRSWKVRVSLAAGLGLSLGAFWLTREDVIWIVPSVLVLMMTAVAGTPRTGRKRLVLAATCAVALLLSWCCVIALSLGNLAHYSKYLVVETKSAEFRAAYGALSRVGAVAYRRYVPVPRNARERVYAVSPSFSELAPFLERRVRTYWLGSSNKGTVTWDDYPASFFIWAMRHSAALAGYHESAPQAAAFYKGLAAEVNAACADKRLECASPRTTLFPVWRNEYFVPLLKEFGRAISALVRFDMFAVEPQPSSGQSLALQLFETMTHERLRRNPMEREPIHLSGWAFSPGQSVRFVVRDRNGSEMPARVRFRSSPAFAAQLRQQSRQVEEARHARFDLRTLCALSCTLDVYAGSRLMEQIPLDELPKSVDSAELFLHLPPPEAPPVHLTMEVGLNRFRLGALEGIGRLYQRAMPALAILATFCYLGLTALAFVNRQDALRWAVATVLLIGLITLLLLVSLVEVTSFTGIRPRYLAPAYPLFLTFAFLSTTVLLRRLAARLKPGDRHWWGSWRRPRL